jgi:AcrR family transcriptional regulator
MQRSRARSLQQASMILDAAHRLIRTKGDAFTTHELVKEAGIAMQTFYRYFVSKDQLLITLLGDMIASNTETLAAAASDLHDPVARLRYYITATLDRLDGNDEDVAAARFVVSAHWQLQRIYADDIARAMQPFADLLLTEIRAGTALGMLHPVDPERAAWLINALLRSVYHTYVFADSQRSINADDLWDFCLTALGGVTDSKRS